MEAAGKPARTIWTGDGGAVRLMSGEMGGGGHVCRIRREGLGTVQISASGYDLVQIYPADRGNV